jgi:predicted PurR-regulated permease PerM
MQETGIRYLLSLTTTLLMLAAIGLLINTFYSLAAMVAVVLVITYILLGPVNLMETGLKRLFSWMAKPWPKLQRLGKACPLKPRVLAVLLVYLSCFLSITLGGIRYFPILGEQLGELSRKLGNQVTSFSGNIIDWVDRSAGGGTVRNLFADDILKAERQGLLHHRYFHGSHFHGTVYGTQPKIPVSDAEKKVIQHSLIHKTFLQLETSMAAALPDFAAVMGGTFNGLLYALGGLLLTFYLLGDGQRIRSDMLSLFPHSIRSTVGYLLDSFHQVMFAFIKGQVMLGALTGIYMGTIYSIFHVPYALVLGCLFALAELLPIVGTWIGISIGLLVILFNMDPIVAVWVWLCSYGYQTIKDNILAPKVVGDVMGLHPLVIMLALLIGAQTAGLLGVLMALPLASALNVVIRLILQKDPVAQKLPGTHYV